jgi:hypothetical protein
MAVDAKHLAVLIEAVASTARRRVALGLANSLKVAKSAAGLSTADHAEAASVEAEWVAANAALTRYHAANF